MHRLRVLIPDKRPRDIPKKTLIRLSIPKFVGKTDEREGISTRFLHHKRREDGLLCRRRARPSGTLDKSLIQLSTEIVEPVATIVKTRLFIAPQEFLGNYHHSNYNPLALPEVHMPQEDSSPPVAAVPTNPLYDATESTVGMTVTRGLLLLLAWIILGVAIIAALVLFAKARHDGVPGPMALVVPLCIVGGALIAVLVYLGLAVIIRAELLQLKYSRFLARSMEQHLQSSANAERHLLHLRTVVDQFVSAHVLTPPALQPQPQEPGTPTTPPSMPPDASRQILDLLTQLRDAALLSEPQRQQWAAGVLEKRKAMWAAEVQSAVNAQQWKAAHNMIEQIREKLPGDPLCDALSHELAGKQQEKIQHDLQESRDKLQHLMAINAWDQVQQIADALEASYADDPSVQELLQQARHEYQAWHRDGLSMLLTDYKDAVDHRQWIRACNLAQQILERYPEDKLAEKIRGDLTTLRQNAEIQTRHELEAQYSDLIKRQRHEEALAIAQRVLDAYPDSATAREMHKHLPKLLELIKQEKARRQTVGPI